MSRRFEELDWQATPLGAISLRRRRDPSTAIDVYEVKLDDDYLMSSAFTVAEIEVAQMALDSLSGSELTVVVGGLGLGYTAVTVLEDPRVRELLVVERLGPVIDWHRRELVPAGKVLSQDPRCQLIEGDFFTMTAAGTLDGATPNRRFSAIVVDIDHSPRHLLHPSHGSLYDAAGSQSLADQLEPDGVFALWSNDPPDATYSAVLAGAFHDVDVEVVTFANPLQGKEATNTVYLARSPRTLPS